MKITVTQRDILRGQRNRPDRCPIALAIKRRPLVRLLASRVDVSGLTAWIGWPSTWWSGLRPYPLPLKATCFVVDFDAGRIVQPFSFEI